MKKRLISAAAMILIGVPFLLLGGIYSKVFIVIVALGLDYEIATLTKKIDIWYFILTIAFQYLYIFKKEVYYAIPLYILFLFIVAVFRKDIKSDYIFWAGFLGIFITFAMNVALECYEVHNLFLFYIAGLALVCDAGGYFVGRKLGKHKLSEMLSPKKTVEGAIGGVVVAFVVGIIFAYCFNFFEINRIAVIYLAIIVPVFSEIGDLAFSLVKRHFDIKDFSNLIPGHGGLLDRFDSVIFSLVVVGIILGL